MESQTEGKKIWASKTFWFNVLSGAIAVAVSLQSPDIGLSKEFVSVLAMVNTIGNVILRLITDQPISK